MLPLANCGLLAEASPPPPFLQVPLLRMRKWSR